MQNNVSRRRFIGQLSSVSVLVGGLVAPSAIYARLKPSNNEPEGWGNAEDDYGNGTLAPEDNPDSAHLFRRGKGWKVLPNGWDDHDNLEWALRNTDKGGVVRLVSGTYKIGRPVIVPDFDGTLRGVGAAHTTVTCTDEFNYEIWEAPGGGKELGEPKPPPFPRPPVDGSTTRSAPALFAFYKTPLQSGEHPDDRANRIKVKNLRCRSAMIGDLWTFGDEVLCINIINSIDWHNPEAAPATTRQDVAISGVEVDGYSTPEFGPFENACSCITILGGVILTSNYDLDGDVDGDALGSVNGGLLGVTPAEGDVTFDSCTFRNCRFGPGAVGYTGGTMVWKNNTTDGCRANCLQIYEVGDSRVLVKGNDLQCDSFLLPPEMAGGATDVPSSLGCVVVIQGMGAALGYPNNLRWAELAFDPAAHAAHPEAGPIGTWRPQGPQLAPLSSSLRVIGNDCQSSESANTYCFHIIDLVNLAFGVPSVSAIVRGNDCSGSQTCVSLEHADDVEVVRNECSSQAFGIELHNAAGATIARNSFDFTHAVDGCEIQLLSLGEKVDFSRVAPGAGVCRYQN